MLSKILLVTNEYPPEKIAGTAISTRCLAEELTTKGYDVTVVVTSSKDGPSRVLDGTIEVYRLKPVDLRMTRMIQRAILVARIAQRKRPDIMQGQSLSCGFLAALVGRSLRIPSVTYIQGYDLYESGRLARRTYIRWALRHSRRLVAVTEELGQKAAILAERHVDVIPHGLKVHKTHNIDRRTARAQLGFPEDIGIVLFVGRLISNKGVKYLVEAMPFVLAMHPNTRLLVVGEGEEKFRLAALAHELRIDDRVILMGQRSHEDVIRIMRAANVFVLPSLAEPFGIVLVEAMSCGLPIVATRVMGIPWIIRDRANGYLVPAGDAMALARRISQLLANPAESNAIGLRNVEQAGDYAMPHVADRFLRLWTEATAANRESREPA